MASDDDTADPAFLAARMAAVHVLGSVTAWSLPSHVWTQDDPAHPSVTHVLDRMARSLAEGDGRALAAAVADLRRYASRGQQVETRGVPVGSLTTTSADTNAGTTRTDHIGPSLEIRLRIGVLVTKLDVPTAETGTDQGGRRAGHEG